MYRTTFNDDCIHVSQSDNVWKLNRNGHTVAVIERAWDDVHWLLFIVDDIGELACKGAYRHLPTIKTCLRIWTRRNPLGTPTHC